MGETQWDIQEVKRLKKKQVIQYNLAMLLVFVLFGYFVEIGKVSMIFVMFCVLCWIIAVTSLYTLNTGKPVGTKTNKRLQEFDRDRLGEKRWKRRTMIGAVLISVVSVALTVFLFYTNFENSRMEFPRDAFPLIGVWVGYNLGELVRISNL
ncbi:hypothetical protein [Radiobacillus sp. PE A8.2]|uniref:hypothetical protein n=1 Tax=Radiobacillus sp. PE A8.2 TaxID=3380349 RepID=UPI00388F2EC2